MECFCPDTVISLCCTPHGAHQPLSLSLALSTRNDASDRKKGSKVPLFLFHLNCFPFHFGTTPNCVSLFRTPSTKWTEGQRESVCNLQRGRGLPTNKQTDSHCLVCVPRSSSGPRVLCVGSQRVASIISAGRKNGLCFRSLIRTIYCCVSLSLSLCLCMCQAHTNALNNFPPFDFRLSPAVL